MAQDIKAGDIMTSEVVTVRPDASVKEIARALHAHRVSGLPVVDERNHVVGVVTEDDLILRVAGPHLPPHIELLGGVIYLENPLHLDEKLRKAMGVTAAEIMTRDPITVTVDTPLGDLADLMVRRKVDRLPVVDNEQLVGIITRHDVISTLVGD